MWLVRRILHLNRRTFLVEHALGPGRRTTAAPGVPPHQRDPPGIGIQVVCNSPPRSGRPHRHRQAPPDMGFRARAGSRPIRQGSHRRVPVPRIGRDRCPGCPSRNHRRARTPTAATPTPGPAGPGIDAASSGSPSGPVMDRGLNGDAVTRPRPRHARRRPGWPVRVRQAASR